MWADTLTVEDYQNLIDRGWRRSGKYCYKPTMDETCCPQYTIKCDALHFSLTKSQKKVIKKFNKYLQDGILKKDSECDHVEDEVHRQEHVDFKKDIAAINIGEVKAGFQEGGEISNIDIKDNPIEPENSNVKLNISAPNSEPLNNQTHKSNSCAENPMEQSRPPCKKAKVLRLERKKEKLLKKGLVLEEKTPQAPKTLEQFMEEIPDIAKGKLKLHIVPTGEASIVFDRTRDAEYELYKKYQIRVHNDPPEKFSMKSFTRFLVTTPLKIAISRMSKESDSFKVTAQLYQTYQMIIHNDLPDECEEENFCQFLIDSPLQPERVPDGPGYGTFHQQYWIDDKLIAVGVIDILPRCVSSVYFFYDPDYRGLTLGTYGALREVYFTRSLQEHLPHLNSYYMGFYIHSCQKMRYKGRFTPSYLLCPETYQWFPIEQCIKKLEESKYARFVDDIDAIDGYLPSQRDVMHMQVVYKYRLMLFKDLKKIVDETEMFKKIGQLVGKKCANTMVFFIR
ncbi:unnamed protein product [Acanthoscelides obtectus]|uniref:Arginyl-tRNA--protein transferase 1 n=1 Tax=Acanthoscelides obtectus TaxID=200917 RepID=A0A9P0PCK2_ACAOB|nr:unnamed protein product [Acanthoscelides obtectus]CAK1667619.1 Arginyl-tRNA--protein transferase 1 [Acanthoscelides obtectus]